MQRAHYTAVAIVLHWAIAAAIVVNVLLGWWMHEAIEESEKAAAAIAGYQLHKSIGLTVLLLSLVRLGWRIANPPPPLPDKMPVWEAFAAKATHWAFYALMIAVPLSGWIYVSTGWSPEAERPLEVPTLFFGLFQVPHLFGLSHAAEATRASLSEAAIETHELLVWGTLGLLALHVGAALKHWLIDRDHVLSQMVPGLPALGSEPSPGAPPQRRIALIAGFALVLLAAAGAYASFQSATQPTHVAAAEPEAPPLPESAPATTAAPATAAPATATATPSGAPPAWSVSRAQSAIRFSGEHAGVAFNGQFARWRADIRFDPNNLDASRATVTIETGSASDGVALHDQSLPQAEWFNAAEHPTAVFRTTRIRHRGGNEYEARGQLTIKGRAIDIDMPFTLTIEGERATMSGRAEIDRREADLGMSSDPDAEYVSREIAVSVRVVATRAP